MIFPLLPITAFGLLWFASMSAGEAAAKPVTAGE